MDLLAQYSDEDERPTALGEEDGSPTAATAAPRVALKVSAAPEVDTTGMVLYDDRARHEGEVRHLTNVGARKVMYNLPYEDMHAPIVGPAHPFTKDGLAAGLKNHYVGHVENAHMHPVHFEEQYNSWHTSGMGAAPGGQGQLANERMIKAAGADDDANPFKRRKTTAERKAEQDAKASRLEAARAEYDGETPFVLAEKQPWANKERAVNELTDEQKEYLAQLEATRAEKAGSRSGKGKEAKEASSTFHGKAEKDYQGRSWMEAPKDKRKENDYCYLPKKWVHTWSGHTKGVNAIRFFPQTGHLLLSAGLDGQVKIWDVYNNQKCMRTYSGHSEGVRDVWFTNDGRHFLSTAYDGKINLWDTETGQVVRCFNTGKVHFCVRVHPGDDKQNVILTGCKDKKIYQFDTNTGDVVTEYNYHLGPVNSVTFIDEGRQFISTSDDKTIRVWELGVPVQIKYIADPSMHSMPAVTLSPDRKFILGQSLDNQILTYMVAKDRFKPMKNKTFKGHNTAGYACQPQFSADQRYVMSGDSEGRCFFWEWSHAQKIVRTIKAHEKVCIGCEWHPYETSKVATCSWDGLIKYWD